MTEDGSLRAVSAVSSLCLDTKPNAVRKSTKSTSSTNGKGSSPLPSSVQSLTSETEAMNEIRLGTHVLVPEGTTAHTIVDLLNIFFLWESSVHPLISRPAFLEHMAHGGRYFSPLLHNVSERATTNALNLGPLTMKSFRQCWLAHVSFQEPLGI